MSLLRRPELDDLDYDIGGLASSDPYVKPPLGLHEDIQRKDAQFIPGLNEKLENIPISVL